jgi:membrane protein DedA with SNARE-associated domain
MDSILDIVTDLPSDRSVLYIALVLFVTPLLHEDVAIIAAALLVAQHRLSLQLAFASIFAGMVVRDVLLYGLGAAARHNALARYYLISPRIQLLSAWLRGKILWIVFVGRVVPGLMFPSYIAIGWFGLPFRRYFIATTILSVGYLPSVFAIAYILGSAALSHVGNWAWLVLLVPIAGALILGVRTSVLRRRRSDPSVKPPKPPLAPQ